MQIYLAYDGELYDYLEKGNHGDRIRYEPNNQEGIALYEIVLDDNGEKELKEIYEGNVFLNEQVIREDVNEDQSEGDIKLIITENNSSEDKKKTKKEKREKKDKKKSSKDKKKSKKHKKEKKDKKDKKKSKKGSHKDKKE